MKKIKDERLILQNLNNIRIAFIVQTLGIIGILGYDLFTNGIDEMRNNPLWMLFILTSVVYAYLSMNVSIDHEENAKSPTKGLIISVIILTVISVAVGYFVSITDGYHFKDGLIFGGILFICGTVPALYIYLLRKKRDKELEMED
ncbi:hypothetical protein ACQKCU_03560 [Heyndrickxia sporothermodurans]